MVPSALNANLFFLYIIYHLFTLNSNGTTVYTLLTYNVRTEKDGSTMGQRDIQTYRQLQRHADRYGDNTDGRTDRQTDRRTGRTGQDGRTDQRDGTDGTDGRTGQTDGRDRRTDGTDR